jgi:hypothetical protein
MQFVKDHQLLSTFILASVALLVALIGTDTVNVSFREEEPSATTTTIATTNRNGTPPPGPIRTSLAELERAGDAEFLAAFDGDYGTQSIGGREYANGVSMLVYSDGSGVAELHIQTMGRFESVSGVVGIDGEAQCLETPARVSVVDDLGRTLWGPTVVTSRSRKRFSADVRGAPRVSLVQESLASGPSSCNNGEANPAWGDVFFYES